MLIVEMLFNEKLIVAESEINKATSDNIIELCRKYIQILDEYRQDLYQLRGSDQINLQETSPLARELLEQVRKGIRSAVEITSIKLYQTEMLLNSFLSISAAETVETFNRLEYRGLDNWELKKNSLYSPNNGGFDQVALPEAVETASLLRREAYLKDKITFFSEAKTPSSHAIVE